MRQDKPRRKEPVFRTIAGAFDTGSAAWCRGTIICGRRVNLLSLLAVVILCSAKDNFLDKGEKGYIEDPSSGKKKIIKDNIEQ
ncbi:MAG TPA: hypothetical protein PKH07_09570 [bacterium]|nr:hypothetical protein [bacterium]